MERTPYKESLICLLLLGSDWVELSIGSRLCSVVFGHCGHVEVAKLRQFDEYVQSIDLRAASPHTTAVAGKIPHGKFWNFRGNVQALINNLLYRVGQIKRGQLSLRESAMLKHV